eukprot:4848129-Pyramimonas_sp.AAC.1
MRHTSNEHTEQQLEQLDRAEKRKLVAVKAEYELLMKFMAVVRRNQGEKVYDNHKIETKGRFAVVIGNYHPACATYRATFKVEYHIKRHRCDDDKMRVCLHTVK